MFREYIYSVGIKTKAIRVKGTNWQLRFKPNATQKVNKIL